jgi:hypothetical protein
LAILGVDKDEFKQFKENTNATINELERKLIEKTKTLELAIEHKISDSEMEAKETTNRIIGMEIHSNSLVTKIGDTLREIETYKNSASIELQHITETNANTKNYHIKLEQSLEKQKASQEKLSELLSYLEKRTDETNQKITALENTLSKNEIITQQIEGISELSNKASKITNEIIALQEKSLKRRAEIEEVYLSIFGRDVTSEDGTTHSERGLHDELASTFQDLTEKISTLDGNIEEQANKILEKNKETLDTKIDEFDQLIDFSKQQATSVTDKLKSLLPGSLSAGLSAAYEEKTDSELKELYKHSRIFRSSILLMIAVSTIPFAIDAHLFIDKNLDILQIISNTPNLVISILPLYLPILWLAYSSSKKSNLSKRLIEEYTHKAVLGKTFSGLSTQIESLPNETKVKEELRTRLLFNILQVSAENPGKLITDYNKTDHPFMDALEKSAKLGEAVDALSRIPGFSPLAETLAAKSQRIIDEQSKKIKAGLDSKDDIQLTSRQTQEDNAEKNQQG